MALTRTAKSCRSDAPRLASSLREDAQMTVSNKPGHRGEHEVSRKTIARGMPGDPGVTVVTMLVCFVLISHARLRVHQAPGIPCALCFLRANGFAKLGRIAPRGRGSMLVVIARSDLSAVAQRAKAEATKQSSLRHSGAMRSIEPGISRFRVWCQRTIPE